MKPYVTPENKRGFSEQNLSLFKLIDLTIMGLGAGGKLLITDSFQTGGSTISFYY